MQGRLARPAYRPVGAGAQPAAVLIALDRQERGGTADYPTDSSAVQEVHVSDADTMEAGLHGFREAPTA